MRSEERLEKESAIGTAGKKLIIKLILRDRAASGSRIAGTCICED